MIAFADITLPSGKILAINSTKEDEISALLKLVLISTAGIHFGNSKLLDFQIVSNTEQITHTTCYDRLQIKGEI